MDLDIELRPLKDKIHTGVWLLYTELWQMHETSEMTQVI
jgi:hypothetical protein